MTVTPGWTLPAQKKDGRSVTVVDPATKRGWKAMFTGAGDLKGPPIQRGAGERMRTSHGSTESGTKSVEVQFAEPVAIYGGLVDFQGTLDANDYGEGFLRIPSANPVANGGGTGNCNLVDLGGYNLIVPAAGDGTHDVDLAAAAPVRDEDSAGYWSVDLETGVITSGIDGGGNPVGNCNLLDVEVTPYFVMTFSISRANVDFHVTQDASWIHPNHILRFEITRDQPGALEFAANLRIYRRNITRL